MSRAGAIAIFSRPQFSTRLHVWGPDDGVRSDLLCNRVRQVAPVPRAAKPALPVSVLDRSARMTETSPTKKQISLPNSGSGLLGTPGGPSSTPVGGFLLTAHPLHLLGK
jgi:hypothetical protein